MKKSKNMLAALAGCLALVMLYCGAVSAAPSKDAKFSVDATEIEYDLKSGDGTTAGVTTIHYDNGVAVAQGGATFNSRERTGRLYGGVKAEREDNRLQSEELYIYTEKYFSAVGSAVLTKGDKTLKAPRVDYHDDKQFAETLGGFAHLSAKDGSWLTAGKIVYDTKTGIANATGGVSLKDPKKNLTGSGDMAVYDSHETGYIELIGNATATQDGNTVTGNKLRITNVSGKNNRTQASGNVRIVYYPKEKTEAKEADGATIAQSTEPKAGATIAQSTEPKAEATIAQDTEPKAEATAPDGAKTA